MKPTDVDQTRFILDKVDPVIYNDGEFSVVWGTWVDNQGKVCPKGVGMRWNESGGRNGFPAVGTTPVWLVIPHELSVPFITSLLGKPSANPRAILKALQEIEARGDLTPKPETPATPAA